MINVTIKKINIKRTFIEFNTQSLQTAMILKQNLKQMEKNIYCDFKNFETIDEEELSLY